MKTSQVRAQYQVKDYYKIHHWLSKNHGKANRCESKDCLGKSTHYNWALKKGCKYQRNVNSFIQLCRSCHSKYDFTEDLRKKLSMSQRGRRIPSCWRRVSQYSRDGSFVKDYQNLTECAKELGVSKGYVSLYASGKYPYRNFILGKYKLSFNQ